MEPTFLKQKRTSKPVTLAEKIFICATAALVIFLSTITKKPVVVERKDHGITVKLLDEDANGTVDKKISSLPNGRHMMETPTKEDQDFFSNQQMLAQQ